MAKQDNDALKYLAGFFLWFVGSGVVGGFLHNLSASTWMDFIIIIFVILWGIGIIWGLSKTEF